MVFSVSAGNEIALPAPWRCFAVISISISIIIPTYNEQSHIESMVRSLPVFDGSFEILVADGESTDGTPQIVAKLQEEFPQHLRLVTCERGRAVQLNRGAAEARGEALLFLHADVRLAKEALRNLQAGLARDGVVGGNFDLEFGDLEFGDMKSGGRGFDRKGFWNKTFSLINRWRRWFGIYYGDSGIFVRRKVFDSLRGFRPMPILEDYDFARRLEKAGRTLLLRPPLRVSSRRWRVQGVPATLWSWVVIQGLYLLGVSPERLAGMYKPVRKRPAGNRPAGNWIDP